MIEWYKMAFEKYADFKTRSTRNEFWWFTLCNILVIIALYALVGVAAIMESSILSFIALGIIVIYFLASFIPNLAVLVRRLHDTGRSGWFYFISLIPLVGSIILIVFLAQESQPENNQWGPVPGSSGAGLEDALVDFDKDIV